MEASSIVARQDRVLKNRDQLLAVATQDIKELTDAVVRSAIDQIGSIPDSDIKSKKWTRVKVQQLIQEIVSSVQYEDADPEKLDE